MPFFDFHCHPGLKPQFSDPATKPSPWDFINAKLVVSRDINLRINKLFNETLNSQSNLTQLLQNEVKLIGVILHAPEQKIGQGLSEKKIVNKGKVNLIDTKQLAYLASGVHSYELIKEELRWLQEAVPEIPGAKFKIVSNTADFNEADNNTVFGAIIVEGLHCFFNDPGVADAKEKFLENFNEFTDAHTVVAINVCHMQQNPFCNHAHGIQFINPTYFYPTTKGITPWGEEIIQLMMDKKILADIKHMSIKTRWELYTWFKNDDDSFKQPLICTHAGTTGISIGDKAKYMKQSPVVKFDDKGNKVYEVVHTKPQSRHDKKTYHNCSSINLYDEDIEFIFLSGGIIGLSFDQRILGFADETILLSVTTPHDVEYISDKEAGFFFGPVDPATLKLKTDDEGVWASEDFDDLDQSLYVEMHRRFLINNIIHILWVANKHDGIDLKKAAKQICIGTDFDGLINAIDCCKQADGLQQLKEDIKDPLIDLFISEGLTAINVDEFLDDLFYNNGKNFILNRIRAMRG
ncbi:membrane dipeptidase [Ferruginibacter sp. SUN106]|uniref:membrane dipeptidase n=1 Tax=Ferruginibacter sp. SUN106 TaxID=2978348 RepID=UPI003D35BF0B